MQLITGGDSIKLQPGQVCQFANRIMNGFSTKQKQHNSEFEGGKHKEIKEMVKQKEAVVSFNAKAADQSHKPLVGILTNVSHVSHGSPFVAQTPFIRSLIAVGKKKMNVIVFSLDDIVWRDEQILACKLNERGNWVRVRMPLPDVVFNRLLNRRLERSNPFQRLLKLLEQKHIPLFNGSYFNKAEIYRLVTRDEEMSGHVLHYAPNPTLKQLSEMMQRHQTVFLKPSAGSLGIGIYKISRSPKGGYTLRYRHNKSNRQVAFQSLSSLMQFLRKREGSKLRHYLVQQGAELIQINHCPIDFRFHMHKNGDKGWAIAAIAAKKAGNGSITTHMQNGGTIVTTEGALQHAFGESCKEVLQHAKSVAVKLANVIERQSKHRVGEIGFDIGIDQDKHVWMFEANSKPGRSIFAHPSLRAAGKQSLHYIVNHCVYLSKLHRRARR